MRANLKKLIGFGSIGILFLIIAIYSFYRSEDLLKGVGLEIKGIADGQIFDHPLIKLGGAAKNAKILAINGREIYLDRNWNWQEDLLLQKGYNIITVRALDKFGKVKEEEFRVILKDNFKFPPPPL